MKHLCQPIKAFQIRYGKFDPLLEIKKPMPLQSYISYVEKYFFACKSQDHKIWIIIRNPLMVETNNGNQQFLSYEEWKKEWVKERWCMTVCQLFYACYIFYSGSKLVELSKIISTLMQ